MEKIVKKCFLFKDLPDNHIEELINSSKLVRKKFKRGEYINNPRGYIVIIEEGEISVGKNLYSGKKIILNKLEAGEIYGISNILRRCEENINIQIESSKDSCLIFIVEDQLLDWLQRDKLLLKNYIKYINRKICFLNSRIDCFANDNLKERIGDYLSSGEGTEKNLNKSELADYLGISRASLYRILKEME